MKGRPTLAFVLTLAVVVASGACTADRFAGPGQPDILPVSLSDSSSVLDAGNTETSSAPQLLSCPGPSSATSSAALIGPEGGTVERGPFTLTIPAGALRETALVRLTRPARDHLVIEATVGEVSHYQFARPVDFAVSVTRYCPGVTEEMVAQLRSLWLDAPGGVKPVQSYGDRAAGKIKFSTDHFSSYGIAW